MTGCLLPVPLHRGAQERDLPLEARTSRAHRQVQAQREPLPRRQRRFLPLFATQLLNAFNDNLFKNAMVLFVVYSVYNSEEAEAQFSAIASGLFILPFFVLSAMSGQLADMRDKAFIIRCVKLAEIFIIDAIRRWEPRVQITTTRITREEHTLQVLIEFVVRGDLNETHVLALRLTGEGAVGING